MTVWSGIFYPLNLRKQAETIAAGRPYCISAQSDGVFIQGLADLTYLTIDKARGRSFYGRVRYSGPKTPRLVVRTGTLQAYAQFRIRIGDPTPTNELSDVVVHDVPLSPFDTWDMREVVDDLAYQCVPRVDDLRAPPTPGRRGFATIYGNLIIPDALLPGNGFSQQDQPWPTVSLAAPLQGFPSATGLEVSLWPLGDRFFYSRDKVEDMREILETMPSGLVRVNEGLDLMMYLHLTPEGDARTLIYCYETQGAKGSSDFRPAVCVHQFLKPGAGDGAKFIFSVRYPPDELPKWAAIEAAILAQTAEITLEE
jgi:hypothetical protein